jgi:hypothetical protein
MSLQKYKSFLAKYALPYMKVLVFLLFFSVFGFAREAVFRVGQEWQLELGQLTWLGQLREEKNGVWLADGFINESGEEQPATLALLTLEEQQDLELPKTEGAYWAFEVNLYDKVKSDSGVAYKCVFDLAKGDYLDTGEIISIVGERFDYTITIAGPQLTERGNSCSARQPG